MTPLQTLREGLTDESLRFAIFVGLATVPFTLVLSWEPIPDDGAAGVSISGLPVLLAALLVGYRYSDRSTETRRAGIWTGLAASSAAVLLAVANAVRPIAIGSVSTEFDVFLALILPFSLAFGVGATILVTTVVAQFAGWVTRRLEHRRQGGDARASDAASDPDPKWRYAIVAYVLVAPPVLYAALWVMPDGGVAFALTGLGLFALVPLALVALVGLFIDVTASRDREAEWIPSVWAYVGVPLGTYALVYAAAVHRGSINPAGDAMYGFVGALWLATVVYLLNRYRHDADRNSVAGQPS